MPGMAKLLQQLGIDETEFFRRCNASFKLGVRFDNWSVGESGHPACFFHPFNYPPFVEGRSPAYHFNRFGPPADCTYFADALAPNMAVIRAQKGPRPAGGKDYEAALGYSYHLDAGLFAGFLRD